MAEPIAIGAVLQSVKALKVAQAQQGTKTFTKPKTIFGKLVGGISGRTAGYTEQEKIKQENQGMPSMNQARRATDVPVSGGFQFGGEAAKKTYLPFVAVIAVVLIFVFGRKKRRGRR